jgi:BlaI family penicillinase repressor
MGHGTRITDGEWAVLRLLWEMGSAPIRELTAALYPQGGPSEYATVHKFLERLEAKGCVRRERQGGVYIFKPAVQRDEIVGQELEALIKKMGGSLQPLLANLVRTKGLTADELRELLALVETLDRNKSRGKRHKGK